MGLFDRFKKNRPAPDADEARDVDAQDVEDAADQSHSTESPTPEIYTLDVSRHLTSGRWRLLRVH